MKTVNGLLLAAGIGIFCACGNGSNNQDSVDSAKQANDSIIKNRDSSGNVTTATPADKTTTDFAVEAANGGLMEVEMGKLAQTNAASQRVKDYGAMLEKDHGEANAKLKDLARRKDIVLPDSLGNDAKKHMEELSKKKGKDFDKAYMDMMVSDHNKDIDKFQKASSDVKDLDIKTFASTTLPTLQKHLDSAKAITGKKN
ncbi:putative membrane protein [Filimonas lacunae]|uniref:Putative membrane protein n=1 Tax=Filimonas lacunae TaxID=477680 RepID=A0A173MB45_9BACT|nr:DUF4142 domain-containing protein [Filimonas lacunae]BAV04752.1 exported protein [Filimonas lacunae]SIT32177.1 putative membrane protein [Filimonas lacunae]